MIAADGEDATVDVLRGWAANAEVYANDVALLDAMAAGACEIGVVNHYYLARLLEEDPDAPIGLLWAEQDGRGVHINISGGGVTRYADDVELAQQFLEWLATDGQDTLVADNHEYPANPAVRSGAADPRHVRDRLRPRPRCAPTCSARSTLRRYGRWTPRTSADVLVGSRRVAGAARRPGGPGRARAPVRPARVGADARRRRRPGDRPDRHVGDEHPAAERRGVAAAVGDPAA